VLRSESVQLTDISSKADVRTARKVFVSCTNWMQVGRHHRKPASSAARAGGKRPHWRTGISSVVDKFELEVFGDRVEVYRLHDKDTDIYKFKGPHRWVVAHVGK
jgi:hypothetical protein